MTPLRLDSFQLESAQNGYNLTTMTPNPVVKIYTDGGCKPNPGAGGWAAVLMYGDHRKELSGGAPHTTNNQMELIGAITALETLTRPCQVELYTDSQYLKNGITSWIKTWKQNNWKTAGKSPVKNQELWIRLDGLVQQHQVRWHWVRGHADDELNNLVDVLATKARQAYE